MASSTRCCPNKAGGCRPNMAGGGAGCPNMAGGCADASFRASHTPSMAVLGRPAAPGSGVAPKWPIRVAAIVCASSGVYRQSPPTERSEVGRANLAVQQTGRAVRLPERDGARGDGCGESALRAGERDRA
eukprot:5448728-Prymnesium_polylepis.2